MLKIKTKLQSATIFKNANLLSLFSIGKKLRENENLKNFNQFILQRGAR